jgi:hypothetical protein
LTTQDTAATQTPASDWTTGFPDDLKSFVTAKGARSAADLATAFAKADTDAAALIPPPKDGFWDDAARAKLGIPAKPEEYKLTRPKLPDGMPYDEALEAAALPIAHKLGLTPPQLQGLVDFIAIHRAGETEQVLGAWQAETEAASEALRKEWGANYDRQLSLAARTAKRVGGDELMTALNDSGFGNNPHLVRAFAKVAGLIGEDTMKSDGTPTAPAGDAALAEIARIQGEALKDPKHPWINASHPEHETTLERMRALFAAAQPTPRTDRDR